jgi:hypothetical protein
MISVALFDLPPVINRWQWCRNFKTAALGRTNLGQELVDREAQLAGLLIEVARAL